MSTPNHTPGPWHVGLRPGPMVYGPQGEQIVGINVMLDRDEVLANMKFIAAAPAMYAESKTLCSLVRAFMNDNRLYDGQLIQAIHNLETALAQAEGRG